MNFRERVRRVNSLESAVDNRLEKARVDRDKTGLDPSTALLFPPHFGALNLGLDAVNRSFGIDEKLAVEFTKHIGAQRLDTLGFSVSLTALVFSR